MRGRGVEVSKTLFYAGTRKGVTMNLRKHQVVNNSEISQGEQDYEE